VAGKHTIFALFPMPYYRYTLATYFSLLQRKVSMLSFIYSAHF